MKPLIAPLIMVALGALFFFAGPSAWLSATLNGLLGDNVLSGVLFVAIAVVVAAVVWALLQQVFGKPVAR